MTPIHQSDAPASFCRKTGRYGKIAPPPAHTMKSAAATTNSCRRPCGVAQAPAPASPRRRPCGGVLWAGRRPAVVVGVGCAWGHVAGGHSVSTPGPRAENRDRNCLTPILLARPR